jgi:hypothetical protein
MFYAMLQRDKDSSELIESGGWREKRASALTEAHSSRRAGSFPTLLTSSDPPIIPHGEQKNLSFREVLMTSLLLTG